jgi:hypothetical protein
MQETGGIWRATLGLACAHSHKCRRRVILILTVVSLSHALKTSFLSVLPQQPGGLKHADTHSAGRPAPGVAYIFMPVPLFPLRLLPSPPFYPTWALKQGRILSVPEDFTVTLRVGSTFGIEEQQN